MPADEHFFGFGFMRKTLDAKGEKITFKRGYRWQEATVPFFMSTRGYAFYSNSVFNHEFDFTIKSDNGTGDYYSIHSNGKGMDFYIIYGPEFTRLLDRYTDLTGKSMLVPRWAFGLQYRLRYSGNQEELMSIARKFRNKEIPCDIMALEPGWEDVPYSMTWKWSPERFPNPEQMLSELDSMGYKLDLWESGTAPTNNISDSKTREEWYAKRKAIVDMGVKMFKQDDPYPRSIEHTELFDPVLAEHKYNDNNLTAEEVYNVSNTLYTETLFNKFRKQTNERAVVMFHAYNASVASHRWLFQWAGDFQADNGLLNASLSGHAIVSYDIRNPYPAGWHQGFFTPFTVINSWAYYREPWLYSESMEQSHRLYACLRSRLVPYFYSSLWQAHKTGLPIERPMVLNHQHDPATYQMKSQFMVGDWFLLGLSDWDDSPAGEKIDFWAGVQKENHGRIYLPEGKWINYWNGTEKDITKAQWVYEQWPELIGGLLYVKAGAIIPMGNVKNYIDENKDIVIVLDVYPHKTSSYQLYEDDGITYKYEEGAYAVTDVVCTQADNEVKMSISARKGEYSGMPEKRTFLVKMHSLLQPAGIEVDGSALTYYSNWKDLIFNDNHCGWYYDAQSKKSIIKLDKGWQYKLNERNENPLTTIPLTAKDERILLNENADFPNAAREIRVSYPEKIVVEFSSNIETLPADGISLTKCKLFSVGQNNPGKVNMSIEGPATFKNGELNKTFESQKDKSFEIKAGTQPGVAKIIVTGDKIETATFQIPVYGKPVRLNLEEPESVLPADGKAKIKVYAKLYDEGNRLVPNVSSPVIVKINGEGVFENGLKIDTFFVHSGEAVIPVKSTQKPGEIKITASYKDLDSQELEITSVSGVLQVRINPPLMTRATWMPKEVAVFVNFKAGDRWVKTATNKVTLNVYNKQNELLDSYIQESKNGEVIFRNIPYYNRPAQCLFEIKSDGYETVTRKVFENTWDN